jgi:lipid-A-disaccharide synthase
LRYYFITGEASGDMYGATCIEEIRKIDSTAVFAFTGGDRMEMESGSEADVHIRNMAFMGFVDVLKNIRAIRKNFSIVKKSILKFKPHLLVLIDYPGFNLRMARWAHRHGIRVDYYISPTVWAWKENRVQDIKKYVNRLFVILPFEEDFYEKHQYKAHYVGHPLADEINKRKKTMADEKSFRTGNNLGEKPLIAILPGSRKQEIDRMLHIMLTVTAKFPQYEFVVAGSTAVNKEYFRPALDHGVKVIYGGTYELMSYAQAGLIKSGTSTLESALLKLPQVVCYKGGALSFAIGKMLVNIKFISLVNLILQREAVKELIQEALTSENLVTELQKLLHDTSYRSRVLADYDELIAMLRPAGASAKLAAYLVEDAGMSA